MSPHRYGSHDPSTARTLITVGAGPHAREVPVHPDVLRQREQLNQLAAGRPVEPAPVPASGVTAEEWAIFLAAIRSAARDGVVHQDDVRPLIRGRIHPKHIGLAYKRAKAERLLVPIDREQSGDRLGRNTHHLSPVYELRSAA